MSDDTTITRIPLDAVIRREGYLAGRRGLTEKDNPYPDVTREALTWHLGMLDGRNKRLHVVDER